MWWIITKKSIMRGSKEYRGKLKGNQRVYKIK
jgi:hypothetical protein